MTKNPNVITSTSDSPGQSQYLPIVSFGLMIFGFLCFVVAFLAAGKLILLYLVWRFPQDPAGVIVPQVISLALLFLMGWGVSLITIRVLNNQFYAFVLGVLGIFVSFGMVGIYVMGIMKTYNERDLGVEKYALVLFAGYLVLVSFYLLTEKADLRLTILPLMIPLALHPFLLVFHNIFYTPQKLYFFAFDLEMMVILLILMGLMVRREPYKPMQQAIKAILKTNTPKLLPGSQPKLLS